MEKISQMTDGIIHISETKLLDMSAPVASANIRLLKQGQRPLCMDDDEPESPSERPTSNYENGYTASAPIDALDAQRSNFPQCMIKHNPRKSLGEPVPVSSSISEIPDPTCTAPARDLSHAPFAPSRAFPILDEPFLRSSGLFGGTYDDSPQRSPTPPLGQK